MLSRIARVGMAAALVLSVAALGLLSAAAASKGPLPSFESQMCGLPARWLELIQRGTRVGRTGQISYLPRTPIYFAGGGDGWSHSGPWPYLQQVPLVFYGPGIIDPVGLVDDSQERTLADVAPTMAALLQGSLSSTDGQVLGEVTSLEDSVGRANPKLIVTMVWDAGGYNVLEGHPGAWPNLERIMNEGVTYRVDVGSSPSVTPAIHTTIGTGVFPDTHGITGVPLLDDDGVAVDPFLDGASGRFVETPALAERWDEQTGNKALVGMVGHVPWHLGMIGVGAERTGGDRDNAAWLDPETNAWVTNEEHYSLPPSFGDQSDLRAEIDRFDRSDGAYDQRWQGVPTVDRTRWDELPIFAEDHTEEMIALMDSEGYGRDKITDLMFTNYKQIDLLGHYFNMASPQVEAALSATDDALGDILDYLDTTVGRGRYVVVMTADHGQQPTAEAVDSFGIDSNELLADLTARFGPVIQDVAPTEVFVDEPALEAAGSTLDDVARFVGDYRLGDNATGVVQQVLGAGRYDPYDRLFVMAVPSRMLSEVSC